MKDVRYRLAVAALAGSTALVVAACGSGSSSGSPGSASGSSGGGSKTEITLLTDNADTTVKNANAIIAAFQKTNPEITVKLNTRPGGGDGDNLVKTKLSTGTMEDVFWYNSGSLLQALSPDKNLVDLTNDPAIANVDKSFFPAVTQSGKIYGAPFGDSMGGGILYNKKVYTQLGLSVPKTWADFEANNDKIKAAGITPIVGSFKDTWTTQLFVLGDFCNIAAAEPNWATDYTGNKVKYATDPTALRGFEKTAEMNAKGWLNKGSGSTTFAQGMTQLATGKAAQFPLLTFPIGTLPKDQGQNIGFFGIPGDDASKNCATLWEPGGQYIPQASKHIDAAKKFVAFAASPAGVEAGYAVVPPTGPSLIKGVTVPADALPVINDIKAYIDGGNNSPALEFLSPVKGPALEQVTTAVETGQTPAKDGAAQYDADVTKQAKQLGLPGW
jgi:raffinose/stachyose/melibiose transport system substrate-binding protein